MVKNNLNKLNRKNNQSHWTKFQKDQLVKNKMVITKRKLKIYKKYSIKIKIIFYL
jgi:hypothetical protein